VTGGPAWLAAVINGTQPVWPFEAERCVDKLVSMARDHGVVALMDWRLKQAQLERGGPCVPEALAQSFTVSARHEALASMMLEGETRSVLNKMAEEGLPGLLLKGSALAYWAYLEPHLRTCGDVDLLLPSREVAELLADRLCAAGLDRSEASGDLVAYELMCRRRISEEWQLEIDVHWRLTNSPLFSDVFTFDELMADSIPLARLAPNARGLGPVHALLHACMHRALNLSNGVDDKLKWLYDLIVLMNVFTPADWQRMVRLSINKKLAGVVLSGLETASTTFRHELPANIRVTLKQAAVSEPLDVQRLSDWRYMQRKTFEALPTLALRLRWLWQRVFPSKDYLAYLYDCENRNYAALMMHRFKKVIQQIRR